MKKKQIKQTQQRVPTLERKRQLEKNWAKSRPITPDELPANASQKLIDNVKGDMPSLGHSVDDSEVNDLSPIEAVRLGIEVTRTRQYNGYRLCRETKLGFWFIDGLEDQGKFTSLSEAKQGVDQYLSKRSKEVQKA